MVQEICTHLAPWWTNVKPCLAQLNFKTESIEMDLHRSLPGTTLPGAASPFVPDIEIWVVRLSQFTTLVIFFIHRIQITISKSRIVGPWAFCHFVAPPTIHFQDHQCRARCSSSDMTSFLAAWMLCCLVVGTPLLVTSTCSPDREFEKMFALRFYCLVVAKLTRGGPASQMLTVHPVAVVKPKKNSIISGK